MMRVTLLYAADLFNQTSQRILEPFSHAAINARRQSVHNYLPSSMARYSLVQLCELEQRGVSELAQHTTRQREVSKPASEVRECVAPTTTLPRSQVGRQFHTALW